MRSPDDYSKKLFIARDIENKPETDSFRAVETVDKKLNQYPFYIGTRLFGSSVKGYSLPEVIDSDVDLRVIYDPEKIIKKEFQDLEFARDVEEFNLDQTSGSKRPVNITIYPFSINEITNTVQQGKIQEVSTGIAQLSGLIKGQRVNEYRTLVKNLIETLSPDQKEKIIQDVASALIFEDSRSEKKIKERMNFSKPEFHQMLAQRRGLWINRLRKLYNVPKMETD